MSRKDLIRTTASIVYPGRTPIPLGEFRTFTGGELTSADVKSVRGAGAVEKARGGRQTVGNVTIAREFDTSLDDLVWLGSQRGRAPMNVIRQPLDPEGAPYGKAQVFSGILMAVRPGEGDNMSDSDLDEYELEMSCDGVITQS